jgi:RNA polymerase sigma-70 factor, ECF subfamily
VANDDAKIVQSALDGNEDAFAELWEKYQLETQKWAFHYVRNLFEAEEVSQEAFAEAYNRLRELRDPQKFGGWLRRIVTNIAISQLRRRRPTVPFEEVSGILINGRWMKQYNRYELPSLDASPEQQAQTEKLDAAIRKLPPKYRRTVTMFYFEDRSQEEIATRMETSVTAVKSMLFRARKRLKKELEP